MKKDMWMTLLLAIFLVTGVSLLNYSKNNKEENYFFVDTPIDVYTPLMSSVKGFPFVIKCNNNQIITASISSGTLQDENGVLKDNKITCETTVYWNEIESSEQIEIVFTSSNEKKEKFILLKNEQNEYSLLK